jgi:Domain of unknown function (DUF5710)
MVMPVGPGARQPGTRAQAPAGRIWLDVPYEDKAIVKRLGGRWEPSAARWYALPGVTGIEPWLPLPPVLPGEDRTFGSGLFVDMIPSTSWFRNVRTAVDARDWFRIRTMVYNRSGYFCEACGVKCVKDDERRQPEAHERFEYLDDDTQKLRRLVCLCSACHEATHFGRAVATGHGERAILHLARVRGTTLEDAVEHAAEKAALYDLMSQRRWPLDLSILSDAGLAVVRSAAA